MRVNDSTEFNIHHWLLFDNCCQTLKCMTEDRRDVARVDAIVIYLFAVGRQAGHPLKGEYLLDRCHVRHFADLLRVKLSCLAARVAL